MKNFHFTTEEEQASIEEIITHRKKKRNKQQFIFMGIFIFIVVMLALYIVRNIVYSDFDGYVVVHNNRMRASQDLFVHDIHKHMGELIVPGDTIYSYVRINDMQNLSMFSSDNTIIAKAREMDLEYKLASQNLSVLEVRLKEIKRQIDVEDHNIRFGLSDNVHKMNLERDYKETREELASQRRKLSVMKEAMNEIMVDVARMEAVNKDGLAFHNVRNKHLMRDLNLVNYYIASDSSIVTKNWISENSLILRGEDIIETQSLDLEKDNVYIMAYVPASKAKVINRGYKAEIIVNKDISYIATVVSMGARTEEMPDAIRNTLSKEHIAAIAVLRVDNGQKIPFWSVVNNLPVTIRINNMDYPDVKPDQYIMFNTPKGLHVPDSLRYLFK